MSTNSSRETGPKDRWSEEAKEQRLYWLCECGLARISPEKIHNHVEEDEHCAEFIDTATGEVKSFIAGGIEDKKYGSNIPATAQMRHELRKNEPYFER